MTKTAKTAALVILSFVSSISWAGILEDKQFYEDQAISKYKSILGYPPSSHTVDWFKSVLKMAKEDKTFKQSFFGDLQDIKSTDDLARRMAKMFIYNSLIYSDIMLERQLLNFNTMKNKLDFSSQYICFAPFADFRDLKMITSIDLSKNLLTTLHPNLFHLSNVAELNLSHNFLSEIPEDIAKLSKLQKLNLRSNRLKKLPDSIIKLDALKTLTVSHNSLTDLPKEIYGMRSLQYLWAGNNKITSLSTNNANLRKIRVLNFDYNPMSLSTIESILTACREIEEIFLSIQKVPLTKGERESVFFSSCLSDFGSKNKLLIGLGYKSTKLDLK